MANTVKKNQTAKVGEKYSYKYVDIAQIHEYLESIDARYIQCTKRIDGDDYIMTKRCFGNEWENEWLQGSKVVDATLYGNDNPAQKQGSALTYARRYSLLMAFGLATEDDDAQALNKKPSDDLKIKVGLFKKIKNLMEEKNVTSEMVKTKYEKTSTEMSVEELKELIKWLEELEVQE